MVKRRYQYVVSKWTKNNVLLENELLQPYLPHMQLLTKQTLLEMLSFYPILYLKPDNGMKGKGIIRLTQQDAQFIVQTSDTNITIPTFEQLTHYLKRLIKDHKYLIQQGIPLLSYDEQPIDFRVLLQRPYDEWVYAGLVGKLGEKNAITTNFASGGQAVRFREIIMQTLHMPYEEIKNLRDELKRISLLISDQLTSSYAGLRELGIDYAIDTEGKIWIIEVNTTPGHQLFKFLPNEKIYQQIVRNFRLINGEVNDSRRRTPGHPLS